jgi:hypothetical protein
LQFVAPPNCLTKLLTQTWRACRSQQLGSFVSVAQSAPVVHSRKVSVAVHEAWMFETQEPHWVDTDCVVQFGIVPPFKTTVAQQ